MLIREEPDRLIGVPQPSHAWLSGQLARAWGNADFARPEPFEEVCLAALQHDIGWLGWERAPSVDPVARRPHSFMEVDLSRKLEDAARAVVDTHTHSLYAAILVSMHFEAIYGPVPAPAAAAFAARQTAFQREAAAALADDPRLGIAIAPDALARNRLLLGAVDRLSIAICAGVRGPVQAIAAPRAGSAIASLTLASRGGPDELTLDPWPFETPELIVRCDARLLRRDGQGVDVAALAAPARRIAIEARLRPG
jgi:hypothetical protein